MRWGHMSNMRMTSSCESGSSQGSREEQEEGMRERSNHSESSGWIPAHGMLADSKYGRFRNESVTSAEEQTTLPAGAMSGQVAPGTPSTSPSLGQPFAEPQCPEEQDVATTFCMMIPRMGQWKFSSPAAFLSRSPSGASKDLSIEKSGASGGLGSMFGACDPVCSTPCTLQVINRLRGGAGGGSRKASRTETYKLPGEEWTRKGTFISKPAQGWLHPDDRLQGPGVSYIVRYMGCIEVLRSMRSLDFNTRTQVTREAINRLYEAVPGVRGTWKKKAPNKSLASILGRSNLRFAGISIAVNISVEGLNLSIPTTRQVIANHHMQAISFASGGDLDTTDYVAYVAKDPINQRACHILECCDGLAQSVISTVGQAFELRFKQFLHSPPKVAAPPDRVVVGSEDLAWVAEEDQNSEHNYYNSIPGKEPPPGGVQDCRVRDLGATNQPNTQITSNGWTQVGTPARRAPVAHSGSQWELEDHGATNDLFHASSGRAIGLRDYEEHMYVNTQTLDELNAEKEPYMIPEDSPKKDIFDMRPFEDALKLHESGLAGSQKLEDQWPSPPTRRAPVAPTEEQLKREPWYQGKMSRREAEKLLQRDGDFLVRDSITNPGQYVLTGMHRGQPKHLLLVDPEGVVRTKDVLFESISHLISYHLHNQQPIVAAESELHLRQVIARKVTS
ncbi:SHC-transforming protein 2 isoform X1 [Hyla sarda]|uniref:SHC-transforming protein 2 isoform X1 n=2 Tax=Hyla sarda TaxID=327740 RepID=UPI0024C38701|nr:SHC-transforming protein 2 isoform X1 [Hyla sarda]